MSGYEIDETSTGGYLGVVKLELASLQGAQEGIGSAGFYAWSNGKLSCWTASCCKMNACNFP